MNLLLIFISIFSNFVMASEYDEPSLFSNEVKIRVSGIVCSFCAYGVERNLSELDFLDKTKFGDDGVLIDIGEQLITIATDSSKKVNFSKVCQAILKGGYEPQKFYLNVSGKIIERDGKILLTDNTSTQTFQLHENEAQKLVGSTVNNLKVIVGLSEIDPLEEGNIVRASLSK
ncbi:hypothetical protein A9Q84_12440 [Halobacteriovorax marinus]|uniref:HMA domain-containing protein n=1 Tax=Halobacteriovorax marinus TaxID=97084 RepID=A0A1Y5FE15_9BACT|nr:hypothetical protein A9Q84_12440 [Halobacteriovorax marinus]